MRKDSGLGYALVPSSHQGSCWWREGRLLFKGEFLPRFGSHIALLIFVPGKAQIDYVEAAYADAWREAGAAMEDEVVEFTCPGVCF